MAAPHTSLTKAIVDYLHMNKIPCWRIVTSGIPKADGGFIPSPNSGLPDVLGLLPHLGGRLFGVEVKIGKDTMKPKQLEIQHQIIAAGGIHIVARKFEDVFVLTPKGGTK